MPDAPKRVRKVIPDLHANPSDQRDYFGRDQFFAWFKIEHPDAKKVSHNTFKRKLTYEAWAACEQYALRSFRRYLGAAVQAGEMKDGTAQYAYDLLYAALETPLPPAPNSPAQPSKLESTKGVHPDWTGVNDAKINRDMHKHAPA